MDELAGLCDDNGIFLTREALRAGFDRRHLKAALQAGRIKRVRQGAYTMGDHWDTLDAGGRHLSTACAAARTAKSEVVISHVSSLVSHTATWWDLPLEEVHLTRLDERAGRREAGVAQHRTRLLPSSITFLPAGLRRTTATRAALEIATITDFERALIVWNGLLHESRTTHQLLAEASVDMYAIPGSLGRELLLRECDGRVESAGETRLYCVIRRAPLPRPEPQYTIRRRGGSVLARLDFAWPELGVWLEFDGKMKYQRHLRPGESVTDAVLRERKREREIEEITGWVCVRVDWADLSHPDRIIARIQEAIARSARRRSA